MALKKMAHLEPSVTWREKKEKRVMCQYIYIEENGSKQKNSVDKEGGKIKKNKEK